MAGVALVGAAFGAGLAGVAIFLDMFLISLDLFAGALLTVALLGEALLIVGLVVALVALTLATTLGAGALVLGATPAAGLAADLTVLDLTEDGTVFLAII